jgi:predicted PurR-regulated permease PerM
MADFAKRALVVAALVVVLLAAWHIADVVLLVFAAVLLATLLRAITDLIRRLAPLGNGIAYGASILLVLAVLGGAGWLFGTQAREQVNGLAQRLPHAIAMLQDWVAQQPWLSPFVEGFDAGGSAKGIASRVGKFAVTGFDALGALALVLFGALYLGAQPGLYRRGLVLLFPPHAHVRVAQALDLAGYAMRRWLLGQLVAMAVLGVLTGAGLWAIGAPSPLALGLLSGLATFVPYIGAVAAGALAVLVAAAQNLNLALWALGVYVGVHALEAHVVMPFVQRWTVSLPPALGVFAVVAIGYLLGPLGVLLATPLTVVAFVLVKKLYLKDTLGEPVPIER